MNEHAERMRIPVDGEAGFGLAVQWKSASGDLGGLFALHALSPGSDWKDVPEDEPDDGLSTPDISEPLAVVAAH